MNLSKNLERVGATLIMLLAIAFSIKNLVEPDLWWQLAAGNYMLSHHALMYADPFSFTFPGTEWMNIKWGYELLIALYVRFTSPQCIPLIQAVVSCVMVYFLSLTAQLFVKKESKTSATVAILAGMFIFLMVAEYRMNSRPEMFSHLFTVIFMYVLLRFEQKESKLIYWLIPLQMIWANMHDGYVVGIMLFVIYGVICWLRVLYKSTEQKPVLFTYAFLLIILATCCNPYGYRLLFKSIGIFNQVKATKYTTEFLDYSHYLYWTKESYITFCVFMIVSLVSLFRMFRAIDPELNRSYITHALSYESILPLAYMGAFFVLALLAYRNVVFLAIVCIPPFIGLLQFIIIQFKESYLEGMRRALLVIFALLYISIVSQKYYAVMHSNSRFGLEMSAVNHPVATGAFLADKQPQQPVFSDYLNSSYLLWKLSPWFKSFIDLRDYEIYTPAFFDRYADAISSGVEFMKQDSQYHFSTVVLLTKQNKALHKFLYTNSTFHLTHVDAVCAVYQKTSGRTSVDYSLAEPIASGGLAKAINHLLNPFYQTYQEQPEQEWKRAATYYLSVGNTGAALGEINRINPSGNEKGLYSDLMGNYYLACLEGDTAGTLQKLDSAAYWFNQAIEASDKNSSSCFGLGLVDYMKGQYRPAVKYLELSLKDDPLNLNTHLYLADCYEKLADFGDAKQNYKNEIEHLKEAYRLNPENPFIETDLGFIYYKLKDCDKAIYFLERIKDFKGLSEEDRNLARQYIINCH